MTASPMPLQSPSIPGVASVDRAPAIEAVRLLASDASSRVELYQEGGVPLVRKSSWFRGLVALRTLLRPSRARREFDRMRDLDQHGVPCVRPVSWRDWRSVGCVRRCELVTECAAGAEDLRALLRAGVAAPERRDLARRVGALLRRLHGAGFCSTTASSRNVLRRGDGELVYCDQPYAARLRWPLASWGRGLDVFDTFFSASRRAEWSATDRFAGLLAYTSGDRALARRIWRRISRRPRTSFRLARQLCRLAVFRKKSEWIDPLMKDPRR